MKCIMYFSVTSDTEREERSLIRRRGACDVGTSSSSIRMRINGSTKGKEQREGCRMMWGTRREAVGRKNSAMSNEREEWNRIPQLIGMKKERSHKQWHNSEE